MASVSRGFSRLKKLPEQVPEEKETLKLLQTFQGADNAAAARWQSSVAASSTTHPLDARKRNLIHGTATGGPESSSRAKRR